MHFLDPSRPTADRGLYHCCWVGRYYMMLMKSVTIMDLNDILESCAIVVWFCFDIGFLFLGVIYTCSLCKPFGFRFFNWIC